MKIYINKINENWVVDRFRSEWIKNNKSQVTEKIKESDIIWIISPWTWKKIPKKYLNKTKVICSIYHIDKNNFDTYDFYSLDQFVDEYHVITDKTIEYLSKLTNKKITSIPFWVNQNIYYEINEKNKLRNELNFNESEFLVGSFQRDTEGFDLESPKLIKGPDIFIDIVKKMNNEITNFKVVLAGKRRQYVINQLEICKIPYEYFEMVDFEMLNKLYNVLDLYLVTSRIEGGPQAILECGITKTPIFSTDVGIASKILHQDSIFSPKLFEFKNVDTNYAYINSKKYTIPEGMKKYKDMFNNLYEN